MLHRERTRGKELNCLDLGTGKTLQLGEVAVQVLRWHRHDNLWCGSSNGLGGHLRLWSTSPAAPWWRLSQRCVLGHVSGIRHLCAFL